MSSRSDRENLRACLSCAFVQRAREFFQRGCPNCEVILQMSNDMERVIECTTSQFDGLIGLVQPKASWVAKWQRIENRMPGLYCVKSSGNLPGYLRERMEAGVP
ncbi:transcription initiation protein spt4 [Acaromyces ingoldii]|uniref:Transcription elongation factor SPT4 n=1 Tax=Acaromyces ingoldii TaxID=215250 RepID=A0A316YT68_9BASI|nr:transcription initiation protein spt4 [Acaromyces ingoldii]PWN92489.1 transcription initiation protein spt4 [Acaromyces ingoldii]